MNTEITNITESGGRAYHGITIEQAHWRTSMLADGKTHSEIAAAFARRYGLRPRTAYRVAHGWTFVAAVARINAYATRMAIVADGKTVMTVPRLWEIEHLPRADRSCNLTAYRLALLAAVYETSIHDLLDDADRDHLRPEARLLIFLITGVPIPAGARHTHDH
jgi:hypothetical protein